MQKGYVNQPGTAGAEGTGRLVPMVAATVALSLLFTGGCGSERPRFPENPNVILVVVDTLRADHLGAYDPAVGFTPELDRLARRSVVFRDTVAQAPNTIGSAPAILGSIFVSEHGYRSYELAVSEDHLMLAEVLQAAGYDTFGVAANPHVAARNGLAQGFDTFIDNPGWTDSDASDLDALFFDWLDHRTVREAPFFALLWAIDPHVPYEPPAEWMERHVARADRSLVSDRTAMPARQPLDEDEQRVSRALYRAEVAYLDHQIGRLLDELDRRGLSEDLLLVVTADHGESFWEHEDVDGRPIVGHGKSLFREEISVPLLVDLPGGAYEGVVVDERVASIDIAPTILDVTGRFTGAARARFHGVSLVDRASGDRAGGGGTGRVVVSELSTIADDGSVEGYMESVETAEGKLVRTHIYRGVRYRPPRADLYDPGLDEPLAADGDLVARRLARELSAWRAGLRPHPAQPAPLRERRRELVERLRALGYLD